MRRPLRSLIIAIAVLLPLAFVLAAVGGAVVYQREKKPPNVREIEMKLPPPSSGGIAVRGPRNAHRFLGPGIPVKAQVSPPEPRSPFSQDLEEIDFQAPLPPRLKRKAGDFRHSRRREGSDWLAGRS